MIVRIEVPDLATVLAPFGEAKGLLGIGDATVSDLYFEEGDEIAEGDVLAALFNEKGTCEIVATASGVIVDGAFRDLDECEQLGFPVFARSSCPTTARGRLTEIGSNVSIVVSGIIVHAGDLVERIADPAKPIASRRRRLRNELKTLAEFAALEDVAAAALGVSA